MRSITIILLLTDSWGWTGIENSKATTMFSDLIDLSEWEVFLEYHFGWCRRATNLIHLILDFQKVCCMLCEWFESLKLQASIVLSLHLHLFLIWSTLLYRGSKASLSECWSARLFLSFCRKVLSPLFISLGVSVAEFHPDYLLLCETGCPLGWRRQFWEEELRMIWLLSFSSPSWETASFYITPSSGPASCIESVTVLGNCLLRAGYSVSGTSSGLKGLNHDKGSVGVLW